MSVLKPMKAPKLDRDKLKATFLDRPAAFYSSLILLIGVFLPFIWWGNDAVRHSWSVLGSVFMDGDRMMNMTRLAHRPICLN